MVALDALDNALIKPPVFLLSYSGVHTTLDKDTCDVKVGFAFLHKQPENTIKIMNWSYLFIEDEWRYDWMQRECYAAVW